MASDLAALTLACRTGRCSSARRKQQTELALLVLDVIPHFGKTGRCSSARRKQPTELALLLLAVIPHFGKTGRCSSARRKQPTELALLVLTVIPHFGKKKNMNIRMRMHMQMHVRKPMTRITIKIYASINTHRRNRTMQLEMKRRE